MTLAPGQPATEIQMAKTKRKAGITSRRRRSQPMTRIKVYKANPPLNLSANVPICLWAEGPAREGLEAILITAGMSTGWLPGAPNHPMDVDLVNVVLFEIGKKILKAAYIAERLSR